MKTTILPRNVKAIEAILRHVSSSGKFHTVTFIKKNGESRVMNGRSGVSKHLKEGSNPRKKPQDLKVLFERTYGETKGQYRSFYPEKITRIAGCGQVWNFVENFND